MVLSKGLTASASIAQKIARCRNLPERGFHLVVARRRDLEATFSNSRISIINFQPDFAFFREFSPAYIVHAPEKSGVVRA